MSWVEKFSLYVFLCIFDNWSAGAEQDNSTLKLISVVFRHGDRTFMPLSAYPNDPYKNEDYYPFGVGQLTSKGKLRMYKVGTVLHERYQKFLGKLYTPELLYARSTNYDRTKNSLQLVLASLFPPKDTALEWNEHLNWNPIPIHYVDRDKDLFLPLSHTQQKFLKILQNYMLTSTYGKKITQKYQSLFETYRQHVGKQVDDLLDILLIWSGLNCQKEYGLKLPSWVTTNVMVTSQKAVVDCFILSGNTTELKQVSGGLILQQILMDSQLKLENKLVPHGRKMFLYSGHDFTIASLLHSLNSFFPHAIPYAAYIIIELHEINGVHGFKVFYQNYEQINLILISIPGCDYFCPFDEFVYILKENLPPTYKLK